ncbi:MAG: NCS1 family transporter [bacterium]
MNTKAEKQIDLYVSPEHAKTLDEDLLPRKERIMGPMSYFAMWLGGCVVIGTFTTGATLVGTVNLAQMIMSIVVGCAIIGVALVMNGRAGHRYGIPMTIQLRSSFGTVGSKLPGFLRAIPAVVWFGFQSWVGGGAVNLILNTLFGFNNLLLCFILFHIFQIWLGARGWQGIKWMENIGAAVILITLAYMGYEAVNRFGTSIATDVIGIKGSWGLGFWTAVNIHVGNYAAILLNVSDLSRNYDESKTNLNRGLIYLGALLPATMMMVLLGLVTAAGTGVYDPVTIFSTTVGNKVLLIATLAFVIFSQITTNVLNNMVPPVYVIMETFKISFKKASWITGAAALCTFPWKLVTPESARGLALFIQIYSAFLGPVFAVMLTDYFIIRKKKLAINELYNPEGAFSKTNWAAVIAVAIGAGCSAIHVDIGWFLGLVPAALSYYLLMTKTTLGASFLFGTEFEQLTSKNSVTM